MIRHLLFVSSIFLSSFHGIKTLPISADPIWSTLLDIHQLNVDGFDDVSVTLAQGNNPFQDNEVTLELEKLRSCKKSSVTIKRSRMLADKSTTVWYGLNTYRGFGDIRYEKSTIEEGPEEFPDFAMFQSYEEKIALVAFGNGTDWIWEGFIGNSIIQHISGNLYVLLDVTFPSPVGFIDTFKKQNYSTTNHELVDLNTKREQIIPEILVALDWKSVENKTARDVIKEVIVYYNAVDMLFSQFTSPRIQLNIAGIVIPKDSRSSPYFEARSCKIEEIYYSDECLSFSPMLDILIRHFRKYIDVFSTKDYDIIMGMTSLPLCDVDGVCEYYGTSFESGTCEHVDGDHYAPITGAVRHPHFRGNYFLAAREIGHILGSKYIPEWAPACYGRIMSEVNDYQDLQQRKLDWSTCAARDISTHIRERENYTKCMWDLPDIFEEPELSSTTETTIEAITVPDASNGCVTTTMTSTAAPDDSTTTETISTDASNGCNTATMTSTAAPDESTTSSAITDTADDSTTTEIISTDCITTTMTSTAAPDESTTPSAITDTADDSTTTEIISTDASNDCITTTITSTAAPDETTTTEIISTAAPDESTTPLPVSTDTIECALPPTIAPDDSTTASSSIINDKENVGNISDKSEIPPTSTETTTIDVTIAEPTTVPENNILTTKKPQTHKKINLNDSVTLIVVKRNVDGSHDVIRKHTKTLKTIVGDMVHNIYDFICKTIKRGSKH